MNQPGTDSPHGGRHAVVIGGSMAGLWATRVLAGHFEQVTLIERDRFPDGPEHRKGVPQARSVHILLIRGLNILKQLFPGFENDLAVAGAVPMDIHRDFALHYRAGWAVRFPSKALILACSRNLLEWSVRRRLSAFPQVKFLEETEAIALL